jgi:hypothetical protein
MACKNWDTEPNYYEVESQRVCRLLQYALTCLNWEHPEWVTRFAARGSCHKEELDRATALLCESCSGMNEEQQRVIIYDGRNPDARSLADWWDRHQESDRRRLAAEADEARRRELRTAALAKLSPEEREALGIRKTIA